MADLYQLFVRLLDGKHKALNFTTPSVSAKSVKHRLCDITAIPVRHQRLTWNGRQLEDQTLISIDGSHVFPTVHLLLRLRGGKGGFGSLLRGAATKAGQKKTNNFDACRDMSGRRLRHVNAEKKLEEWKAEMEERKLEKMAEEFIKKKAKAIKKAGGSGNADKYVEKYRQDSAKCMEEVERSVRESIASHLNSKRKAAADGGSGSEAKRFKIWMGKRKLGGSDSDSDSDDMDEDSNDDDEENEKSVVTNHCTSSKEGGESSDSVNGKLNAESSGAGSPESGSEDDKMALKESLESSERLHGMPVPDMRNIFNEPALEIHEEKIDMPLLEEAAVSGAEAIETENREANVTASSDEDGTVGHPLISSTSAEGFDFSNGETDSEGNRRSESLLVGLEDTTVTSMNEPDIKKPLNFDEFSSAADMEALGLEGLKSELQARGLKCGGTLQERAARLFLLKTTPLEKLPKKLLAKK